MKKYLILTCVCLLFVFDSKAQVEITSAGTATAYTLNVPGVFPLRNGVQVTFKAHTTCSASATMNVSGTGALPIRKEGASLALAANDIKTGQIVTLAYDGANWQMLTQLGTSAAPPTTYWDPSGSDIHNNNAGNVGIGITSPGVVGGSTKYLSVASTNAYSTDPVSLELIGSNTSNAAPVTRMDFIHASDGPLYDAIGSIQTFRNGTNKAGSLSFQTADGSGIIERMRIDNKGNVGIGTTTPATNLQLYGSASTNMSIVSGSTQKSRVYLGSTVTQNLGAMEYDNSTNSLNFWTNGTSNRLVIDNGGKVGVGTASPGSTFEVFQATNPQMRLKTSAGSGVIFDYNNAGFSILNYDNSPLFFGTGSGSVRMNIQTNGNVGIGTGIFTPSAKLHVIGGARFTDLVGPGTVIADASGNLSVAAGTTITGSGTNNYLARWTPSSSQLGIGATYDDGTNVGIGTPAPAKATGANRYLTVSATDVGITSASSSLEMVGNGSAVNTMASRIDFLGVTPVTNAIYTRARIDALTGNGVTGHGQLVFYTFNGALNEAMRIRESGHIGIGGSPGVVGSPLSVGATSQFQIDGSGDLIRINNVPYTWPAANAAGFLSNNGAGTLTWSTAGVLAGGTTNYVPKWSSANSLSSTSLIFDNGTTVGINTAAPSAASKLHVVGAGNGSTLNVEDNTLSNGSVLYLASTSTAGTASNNSRMITIARSGANASSLHTAYGLQSNVTTTGTTSTNIAGYFSSSGATNNYAIIVPSTGGRVGIGTTAPTHSLTLSTDAAGATLQSIKCFNGSGLTASLAFQKGRGTEAIPAAVITGDALGSIDFYGYNSGNTSMQLGASILVRAAQGFSTANWAASNLIFSTSPLNSNVAVDRMTVYYNGNVGIGTSTAPTTAMLKVQGDVEIPAPNDYSYATPKADYFTVSAAGFNASPGNTSVSLDGFDSGNARWFVHGGAAVPEFMYAPVSLPNGAVVTQVDFYVHDADAAYQVIGTLDRHTLGGTVVTNLATTAGSGVAFATGAVTLTDNTIVNATVDNTLYSYFLRFETLQANANLRIYGAKITYTVLKVD
jgi:hypothetical protein